MDKSCTYIASGKHHSVAIRLTFSLLLILCTFILHTQAQNCSPASAFDYLDINNVKARINNGGDMWWDLDSTAEYIVPKSGNVSAVFAGALWIAGTDQQGSLHVAAQTYRQSGNDFFPGPLDISGTVSDQTCLDFDRIWKINKSTIDSFIQGLFSTPPSSIAEWPGKGNPNLTFLPNEDLAPFVDVNGDGTYNPADGDYPGIPGDQALWYVINDAGNTHTQSGGLPLQVEVQVLAYAYNGSGTCLNTTTFYHYRLINKSPNDYQSLYIGLWSDPGLGCQRDDYIGCDSANNIGIVYNAESVDSGCTPNYGTHPPVFALQILKGPTGNNGVTHYMDFMMLYTNDTTVYGNPQQPSDYHNYLRALFRNNSHLKNPLTNHNTDYAFPSDPQDALGWSMCSTSTPLTDLRMIVSSGPIAFEPGEVQTFDVAAVWDSNSVYPCPSFSAITSAASCVKDHFDNDVVFTGEQNQLSSASSASVFPNPSANDAILHFEFQNADRLEVFDLAGKKLFSSDVKNKTSFNLPADELGKGMFIYNLHFSNLKIQTGKLVIE
ncbi:MAG: T9SS type A sorting domain-containing protein [Chitinophagales bacterium]